MADIDGLIESYWRGRLSRRRFVQQLLALGIGAGFIEQIVGVPPTRVLSDSFVQMPSRTPYLVLVVIDGFRTDYQALTPMPNLEWLMSQGTSYSSAWVGQLESYTPASHATISTGAIPRHSGVIGFEWRDPATHKEDLTAWYDGVMSGRLEEQLKQHGVNSIPIALKQSDPAARVVAVSSDKYYAADAMGGSAADYIFFGHAARRHITPLGVPHHAPPKSILEDPKLKRAWPLQYEQYDAMSMDMALESWSQLQPRAMLINLPGVDTYGHSAGGPAAPGVMKRLAAGADKELGRLISAFRNRGILDQTVFAVVADHGMVGNHYQIDRGYLTRMITKGGGHIAFNTGGNSSYIWLKNQKDAKKVAQYLVDNIPHVPVGHYMTIESGNYVYHPVARKGTELDPTLSSAYDFLNATFAGPMSPDISLIFEENTITRLWKAPHGEHGGVNWGAQQIPMVFAGPGIKKGAVSAHPARLVDIAPTILTLLGIPPSNMDGVVLADALISPTDAQVAAQDALAAPLTTYQKALKAQSAAELKTQKGKPGVQSIG